ncbi:hypothetical protein FH603_5881 [Spirosoma sp. LMG 31447]|uniref:Uncharacterized protein n=1 Tax=Spirosoma utsteinense TaxID=2585773 RepID=A0ABR6WFL3_9BACT|nr:hypothetical protein [Spirosoma utsteinense]
MERSGIAFRLALFKTASRYSNRMAFFPFPIFNQMGSFT